MIIVIVLIVILVLMVIIGGIVMMGGDDLMTTIGSEPSEEDIAIVSLMSACQSKCRTSDLVVDNIPAQSDSEILGLAGFCCYSEESGSCFDYYIDCMINGETTESFCISEDYDFSVTGSGGVCPSTTYCCGVLPEST
jgi:hypothetical protein